MSDINLESINQRITDRNDVWYWQTNRDVSYEEAGKIWTDKHQGINTKELLDVVNKKLDIDLAEISDIDINAQEHLGNVNSVRKGKLKDGKEVIIRCHPKGLRNGYFYVESLAARKAVEHGLPAYLTYGIHELEDTNDIAFQVIEKCPGIAIQRWLESNPDDTKKIDYQTGINLAKLHEIKVEGFGPFDNELAKKGKLIGLHDTFAKSVCAGLKKDLDILLDFKIITLEQSDKLNKLFNESNPLLNCKQGVLIQKDYADWNALTDGEKITGILDWDECASGDPITDIASCLSMMAPERAESLLAGYFEGRKKPEDFNDKLELLTLRCVIGNMGMRCQRSKYIKDTELIRLLELGKKQLAVAFKYFDISAKSL